jgi:hypothetical protein
MTSHRRKHASPTHGARETRALAWVRGLVELPERSVGSASEHEAAERVGGWMRELGVPEVELVPLLGRPRSGFVLAIHGAVGLLGLWWGALPGALVCGLAAFSFARELRQRGRVLSGVLGTPSSWNVVGRAGPEAPARRLVLSAHIDAAQAGLLFSPALADFFARSAKARAERGGLPVGPNALPEGLILAAAALAVVSWLGASGFLMGLAQLGVGAGLLVLTVLGLQWALAPTSPGANDNASAVASMLGCAEQLLGRLPPDVELWLVGTGAEEVGCCGMHAFVESRREWPRESTFFVNFECTGGGALHWIRSEGTLGKTGYPPAGVDLARRVAAGGGFDGVTPTDLLAGTDGHVPAQRGFSAVSIISLEENGVPRNYHTAQDVPEALDLGVVVRAGDFGAAVASAWLRGESGAVALV